MYDLIIIGSGASALSAALEAKKQNLDVVVISKLRSFESGSCMAQGGINAVLNDKNDSVEKHITDTIKSAHDLADVQMIESMCKGAKETIEWLSNKGVGFSKEEDGTFSQRKLGAASHSRACYAQDFSGLKILQALSDSCIKEEIVMLEEYFLLSLYPQKTHISATFLDISSGEVVQFDARNTILATGGYASIYRGFSSNRDDSVGSGIVSALKAGVNLSDLEFVQFHPTTLKKSSILISESARGAGGIIYNQNKERFVDELLMRDIVSREIFKQIQSGNEVFLDITHIDHEFLEENLPQEIKLARVYEGINPLLEPIPIKPSAHYTMGGIDVDNKMQSCVERIYAIGECANAKVHGANRLGGNSLLEVVYFARKCVKNIHKESGDVAIEDKTVEDKRVIENIFAQKKRVDFYQVRQKLACEMFEKCGIFRDEKGLKEVLASVQMMKEEISHMGIDDKSRAYNTELVELLEFSNMLELSYAVICAALLRLESRGAHFREDFPQERAQYQKHQIIHQKNGILYSTFGEILS